MSYFPSYKPVVTSSFHLQLFLLKRSETSTGLARLGNPIEGKVDLKVLQDLSISTIEVEISGRSETRIHRTILSVPLGRAEVVKQTLLHNSVVLFPGGEQEPSSSTTLKPGDYQFNFSINFPAFMANPHDEQMIYDDHYPTCMSSLAHKSMIPPSFHISELTDKLSIAYELKVTLSRPERFHSNARIVVPINMAHVRRDTSSEQQNLHTLREMITSTKAIGARLQTDPELTKKDRLCALFRPLGGSSNVEMRLKFSSPESILLNTRPKLALALETSIDSELKPFPLLYIRSFEITLLSRTEVHTQNLSHSYDKSVPLLSLTALMEIPAWRLRRLEPHNDGFKSELDLSNLTDGEMFPEIRAIPSFAIGNVRHSHFIQVCIKVTNGDSSLVSSSEVIQAMQPVLVLGGSSRSKDQILTDEMPIDKRNQSSITRIGPEEYLQCYSDEEQFLPRYEE